MSVQRIQRKTKTVYRVHWREAGRDHTRAFNRKADAVLFDAEVKRRKQVGDLHVLTANRQTLAEFGKEWFEIYAIPNLQPSTRASYAISWDAHILPRLGERRLRDLTPEAISRFRADLERHGHGPASVRRTLVVLQSVLQRATEWQRLTANPVRAVRKPSQRRQKTIVPLAPATIEAIREHLLASNRLRDATFVSVLAYAGLRPGEALALTWHHIRERTLLVEQAVALGQLKSTKTGQTRTVRLLAPLAHDLRQWRLASGNPAPDQLVFPGSHGRPLSDTSFRNWRRRTFQPAAAAAGAPTATSYTLRHSYISLLIREGANIIEIAQQAGHNPTLTLGTYGHLITELADTPRRSAEDEIRAARNAMPGTLSEYLRLASLAQP